MLGLTFSSNLGCGSYIISIAKTTSRKIGALICSMIFFSPVVALYFYKSTISRCMECCCHVWAGAPSCYLKLLYRLQRLIYRTIHCMKSVQIWSYFWSIFSCIQSKYRKIGPEITLYLDTFHAVIGPSLAASLERLTHHQNKASLSLFYRYYFGRCSSELAQLVTLPFFEVGLLVILIDCMILDLKAN